MNAEAAFSLFACARNSGPFSRDEIPRRMLLTCASDQLPDYFQSKLNLSCCGLRPLYRAYLRDQVVMVTRVKNHIVVVGRLKIGAVQSIEGLGSELNFEGFGDTRNIEVLEHGKVEVKFSWPDQSIAADRAVTDDVWRGRQKALGLDVVVNISRINGVRSAARNVIEYWPLESMGRH